MTREPLTWGPPYAKDQLDDAQAKWDLRFPPDLVDLFLDRRPVDPGGRIIDWAKDRDERIRRTLDWPFEGFWFDVENAGVWWPEWGEKPADRDTRFAALKAAFDAAPTLIPNFAHRYIPAEPHEAGNPVFSVRQTDVIYYGVDLMDYFERELGGWDSKPWPAPLKEILFWSLAERRNGLGKDDRSRGRRGNHVTGRTDRD